MSGRSIIYAAWFAIATVMVAALTPLARRLAQRLGMIDQPGGQIYKWHQRPTAYMGGAVIGLVVAALVIASWASDQLAARVLVILLGGLACGAVGLWDDWRPVGALAKILPALAGSIALWLVGVRVGLTGIYFLDFALTIVWVVVVTQSLNVIDNMDGVAVGLAGLTALALFGIAASRQEIRVALMAITIAGACLGFLPYNIRGASVFLGDAGTLFLGFVLASLAISFEISSGPWITHSLVPILLLAVPLFNTAVVIVSRLRGKRAIMQGGTDGVAHRLVALGLTHWQAAMVFWAAGVAANGLAAIVAKEDRTGALIAAAAVAIASVFALWAFQRVDVTGRVVDPLSRTRARWWHRERVAP